MKELFEHPSIWAIVFAFAIIAVGLICLAWVLAELKAKRWNNDYQLLHSLVYNSDVNRDSYVAICQEFDSLDYNCDKEYYLKKSLWSDFQFRFREYSPYNIDEK
jgi:hypothetical protein